MVHPISRSGVRAGSAGRRATALLATAAGLLAAVAALAAPTGKVRGRIIASNTKEPVPFGDVALVPADSTVKPVGGLTDSDGTFLLEAPPGFYSLHYRALSYAPRTLNGVKVAAGETTEVVLALDLEAIVQKEVVVEGRAVHGTESALLAERRKAPSMGDAVSAEQVRKSADRDAGEVLRRVTGLSVQDGKYVFVRGLGERYSSTEVDGVRIASPEQNKRVVPLDLLPASLLDNIVVQKTYTADRPGEFGGGDVQVHTRDFPGRRQWAVSISQGYQEGVTFQHRRTYSSSNADLFGFGADSRRIPDAVYEVAGNRPLLLDTDPTKGFTQAVLTDVAGSFANIWSSTSEHAIPDGTYTATYGNEIRLLGHTLGVIGSGSLSRSFDDQAETYRQFTDVSDTLVNYAVRRSTETVQLGGIAGLSYRVAPGQTIHLRGLYTHSADDEVRTYEGEQHGNTGQSPEDRFLRLRSTRLKYVERQVTSSTLEGQHELSRLLGSSLSWKLTRSTATRLQPDLRETVATHGGYYDGDGKLVDYWAYGGVGTREYGDLRDQGWGGTISDAVPYRLGRMGAGRMVLGLDRQTKKRENFYRRFNIVHSVDEDATGTPEAAYDYPAYVEEHTFANDNYHATQEVTAGYSSFEVPFGRHLRGTFGVRVEHGIQDVRSYDLFDPTLITSQGTLDNTDWLPSANLTWSVAEATNVRVGASRTLSRPDINELSPSVTTEFIGGNQVVGNPNLERATIENYDVRVEAFPGGAEVLAAGAFYKELHDPIEQAIRGGSPGILIPVNSQGGHNRGVELEARTGLGHIWGGLRSMSLNANASLISSEINLKPEDSKLGTGQHPLQGQADYLVNAALTYARPQGHFETSVLVSAVGLRLRALGSSSQPDIYEQPSTSLEAIMSLAFSRYHFKMAARNLLDPRIRQLQGGKEVTGYNRGRSFSIAFSTGS